MQEPDDERDGAKRQGRRHVPLGPQASHILQRLYDPQLGPGRLGGATAAGGNSPLKPRRLTKKTASLAALPPATAIAGSTNHALPHRAPSPTRLIGAAGIDRVPPAHSIHPSLQHVSL
jgi:hypothetical protein